MVFMYHTFLIHSSTDGHLGCVHVLAVVNGAAVTDCILNSIFLGWAILTFLLRVLGILGSEGATCLQLKAADY